MKFLIQQNVKGEVYFNLATDEGNVVATSEGYQQEGATVYDVINDIKEEAVEAPVEDRTE